MDAVYQSKYNSQVKRLLSQAKLRFPDADAVNIYYTDRELDREKMLRLATCQFMETHRNVIFQGFTGSGKSWLVCCIAKEACKRKYRTRYIRTVSYTHLYETAIMPTGVRKPKQKASVEGAVGKIASAVIAALRDRIYLTLDELKKDIRTELEAFNAEPFQKRDGSRLAVYESEEMCIRDSKNSCSGCVRSFNRNSSRISRS